MRMTVRDQLAYRGLIRETAEAIVYVLPRDKILCAYFCDQGKSSQLYDPKVMIRSYYEMIHMEEMANAWIERVLDYQHKNDICVAMVLFALLI